MIQDIQIKSINHQVLHKQQNSKMCLVCGLKNPFGLKASFYELENHELLCIFRPQEYHQSYPGRLHGGIAMTILDESIGRAIMMKQEEMVWGVTIEFTAKLRKPLPYDSELRVVCRITHDHGRIFEGSGEILLPSGEVAVEGNGRYLKMPLSKISDFDEDKEEWKIVKNENDPDTVELPER
jgi:acyl-coenzyme A thioesterase PaaI-like protein